MTKSSLEKKFQNILLYYSIKPPLKGCDKMHGRPDFVIKKKKCVIFIDGAFFHTKHKNHKKMNPQSPLLTSIKKQIIRDREITEHYEKQGWFVLRFSEADINSCPEYVKNAFLLVP